MNHEQTHVRIHRDIALQFRELDYPWPGGAAPAAVLSYAELEFDRPIRAQVRFGSPNECAKNLTVCGGEIARLVQAAAAARPPGE